MKAVILGDISSYFKTPDEDEPTGNNENGSGGKPGPGSTGS